ncbi:MAG: head-tail adaptor protein [Lacipirellulaceae bacterium]
MLPAGALRSVVDLLERGEALDEAGQPRDEWVPVLEGVRAEVLFVSGLEGRRGERTEGVASWRVRCRYLAGVTSAMRVQVRGGPLLDVDSVGDPEGLRRELLMECKATDAPT